MSKEQSKATMKTNMARDSLVWSSFVGIKRHPFGFQEGHQFLRRNQDDRIIIFSMSEEINMNPDTTEEKNSDKRTIIDLPGEILLYVARSCAQNDLICLALTNKTLARAISMLRTSTSQGLEMPVDWSITTAVIFRQALLNRLKCSHSAPNICLCKKCWRQRTVDVTFWRSERQRIKTVEMSSAETGEMVEEDMKSVDVENIFESALQAWQGRLPAAASDSPVMCPYCAAKCQQGCRSHLEYQGKAARFRAIDSAGTDPTSAAHPVSSSSSREADGEGN